jgi:NADPH-dependent 2,4-dienoyl-CoA reductase/sulfur reductase-like enzyme
MNGKRVTMLFPETGVGARIYPRDLSNFLIDYYREHGVEVFAGDVPTRIEPKGKKLAVTTQAARKLVVDGAVAGIGITPSVDLAAQAGLAVDNGIVVDRFCRTASPDIYAAGDVAAFHNPALDARIRVEHEDNAVTMGACAGRNMAGSEEAYDYLPYFYSDLFDLGYEAVGDLDISRCETYADWREPFKEGVIYYLREGRVRGVLLWNVWDKVPAARELIGEPGPFQPEELRARLA